MMPIVTVTPGDSRLLQEIADSIANSKRAIVVTGAGISTNCGIPDFRSENGLYNLVKSRYPDVVVRGRDLFDAILFSDPTSTRLFYTFLASLRNSVLTVKDTSPTHKFIRTLSETGRLLRCYTQNIDGLEEVEGMTTNLALGKGKRKRTSTALNGTNATEEKGCQVVQLHGNLNSLRCMACQGLCKYDDENVESLLDGNPPDCPECVGKDQKRRESGKRGTSVGLLRPNIVLYGEEHPLAEKIGTLTAADLRSNPDCMIVLGTSLKVYGLRAIVKAFAQAVHARKGLVIYINNTAAAHSVWKDVIDYHIEMDCDNWVTDVKIKRPGIWEMQSLLELGKVKKPGIPRKIKNKGDKENIVPRPKVKATGARKPLTTKIGNATAPKKSKKVVAAEAVLLPTPPSTSGSRAEKKAKTPLNCPTTSIYNPPMLPSTPTKARTHKPTITRPVSPTRLPPSPFPTSSFSIEIDVPSREANSLFMDPVTAGESSPEPPHPKRRMLGNDPVIWLKGPTADLQEPRTPTKRKPRRSTREKRKAVA